MNDVRPLTPVCGFCRTRASDEGRELLFCSRCHAVRYCGEACQRAAWTDGHRDACGRVVTSFDETKVRGPFRLEELRFALLNMRDDTPVGPDGFPVLFYKTFFDHLGPTLLKVLEETLEGGQVDAKMSQREVVLVEKEHEKKKKNSVRWRKTETRDAGSRESRTADVDPTSASVHNRPAILRQLRAMTRNPRVDYVIFSGAAIKTDRGVVLLNADARLLFRVNWNHAVFARGADVAGHARLLFSQLGGAPPRDADLDDRLAEQLQLEFGCGVRGDSERREKSAGKNP